MENQRLYSICNTLSLTSCNNSSLNSTNHTFPGYISVSISHNPPWNFESPPGSGCFCGISISVLVLIAEKLGMRFLLSAAATPITKFTAFDGTKYEGAPADLLAGKVNISICPLAVTPLRVRDFQLITGTLTRVYDISIQQRWLVDSAFTDKSIITALFYQAAVSMWPGLLLTALAMSCSLPALRLTEQRKSRFANKVSTQTSLWRKISTVGRWVFWTMEILFSSFFSQVEIKRPKAFAGAHLAVLQWLIYTYFMICLINANASSSLAGSSVTLPFHTLAGFLRSGFSPLVQSKTASVDFVNSYALRPLLPQMRQYDAESSQGAFITYAVNASQTAKIAIFTNPEMPLFTKAGFVVALDTHIFNFVAMYQLQHGSELTEDISNLVNQMATTGALKRIESVHLTALYSAYGISYPPKSVPNRKGSATIRMEILLSTVYIVLGLLFVSCLLFLLEILLRKRSLKVAATSLQ